MTTIFFKLAKIIVIARLDSEMKRMKNADSTTVKRIYRNVDCSGAKRRITSEIREKINDFNGLETDPAFINNASYTLLNGAKGDLTLPDEIIKNIMEALITTCREEGEKTAQVYEQANGKHSDTMVYINTMLKTFYDDCVKNKWLNVKYDPNDPFLIFQYHMASYFAHSIERKFFKSKVTLNHALTADKMHSGMVQLNACEEALRLIDRTNPLYKPQKISDIVIDFLKKLRDDNEKLCNRTQKEIKIPFITGTFFGVEAKGGRIKASRGELKQEIDAAIAAIQAIKPENIVDSLSSTPHVKEVSPPVIRKTAPINNKTPINNKKPNMPEKNTEDAVQSFSA